MSRSSRRLRLSFIGPGIYFCITIYSGERLIRVLWDTLNHDKISWSNLTFAGHCKNVCSSESGVLGWVQTGATTPNIVAPTMLGVVACVLAVVCKRMQQLPTSLGPAVHRRNWIQPRGLCSRWLDPVFLWGYHPTLKLSGITTFTLIVSLTYSMDNI